MKKLHLVWLIFALLVACGSADEASIVADSQEVVIAESASADDTVETIADPTEQPEANASEVATVAPSQPVTNDDYVVATSYAEANVVRASDNVKGSDDYAVLIIEYGDFQCPACAQFAPIMSQVAKDNPDSAKLIFRHFPLRDIHPNAQKAAEAAEAAAAQDAFWAYHDALYERQRDWAQLDATAARDFFVSLAGELGLDADRFGSELDSDFHAPAVNANYDEAIALQLPGTPSILLDGQPIAGQNLPIQIEPWNGYIRDQALMAQMLEQQYDSPPAMMIDEGKQYLATVTLENGEQFTIELYPQSAPQTVNSFVFLAREGFFDGVTFHRVLPNFVAQTGDPSGTGRGGPGYVIPNEIDPDLSHNQPGMVAMANSGPDTNGSQWYITLADTSQLDGSYTIFGMVTDGMDVVQGITPRDPSIDPNAPPGDAIVSIEINEK
jgi:cyclophilin family peptidyl-prolyl cis-trans isomerase/protein-disulfide isomerase